MNNSFFFSLSLLFERKYVIRIFRYFLFFSGFFDFELSKFYCISVLGKGIAPLNSLFSILPRMNKIFTAIIKVKMLIYNAQKTFIHTLSLSNVSILVNILEWHFYVRIFKMSKLDLPKTYFKKNSL